MMGEEDFFKIEGIRLNGKVEHCSKKLFAYKGKQIDAIGQFRAVVCAGNNVKVSTDFVIVKRGCCIVGNVTARELGVLHVGPNVVAAVGCNAVCN